MNAELHQKKLAPAQGIIPQKDSAFNLGGCFSQLTAPGLPAGKTLTSHNISLIAGCDDQESIGSGILPRSAISSTSSLFPIIYTPANGVLFSCIRNNNTRGKVCQ